MYSVSRLNPLLNGNDTLVILSNVRVAGLVKCVTRLSSEVSSADIHVGSLSKPVAALIPNCPQF